MHERVFVCHLALLITAGCFPSRGHQLRSWQYTNGGEEARGGDMCVCACWECCVNACLCVSMHRSCEWALIFQASCFWAFPRVASVWKCTCCSTVCFLSCVWRAHKQEALIPSGVSAGVVFHKVVILPDKGVSNIRQSPYPWANQDLTNPSPGSPTL